MKLSYVPMKPIKMSLNDVVGETDKVGSVIGESDHEKRHDDDVGGVRAHWIEEIVKNGRIGESLLNVTKNQLTPYIAVLDTADFYSRLD